MTAAPPPPLTIALGAEELFADRAVASVVAAARAVDADAEVTELRASELDTGTALELMGPSLFSQRRVVVVRGLGLGRDADEDDDADADAGSGTLPQGVVDVLVSHATSPDAEPVHVVLVHRNANAGRAQLTALRKAPRAVVVDCKPPKKGKALEEFVAAEFAALARTTTPDVPRELVAAVGNDVRGLAAAAGQLAADLPAQHRIDADDVRSFFAGRLEVDGFAVAEALLAGRTAQALTLTRQATAGGTTGPALVAAIAYSVRTLVKAAAAPRGLPLDQAAKAVGLSDWQLRRARQQLGGWTPEGVTRVLRALAVADADVKGAAVATDYAIEQLVIRIGRARSGR